MAGIDKPEYGENVKDKIVRATGTQVGNEVGEHGKKMAEELEQVDFGAIVGEFNSLRKAMGILISERSLLVQVRISKSKNENRYVVEYKPVMYSNGRYHETNQNAFPSKDIFIEDADKKSWKDIWDELAGKIGVLREDIKVSHNEHEKNQGEEERKAREAKIRKNKTNKRKTRKSNGVEKPKNNFIKKSSKKTGQTINLDNGQSKNLGTKVVAENAVEQQIIPDQYKYIEENEDKYREMLLEDLYKRKIKITVPWAIVHKQDLVDHALFMCDVAGIAPPDDLFTNVFEEKEVVPYRMYSSVAEGSEQEEENQKVVDRVRDYIFYYKNNVVLGSSKENQDKAEAKPEKKEINLEVNSEKYKHIMLEVELILRNVEEYFDIKLFDEEKKDDYIANLQNQIKASKLDLHGVDFMGYGDEDESIKALAPAIVDLFEKEFKIAPPENLIIEIFERGESVPYGAEGIEDTDQNEAVLEDIRNRVREKYKNYFWASRMKTEAIQYSNELKKLKAHVFSEEYDEERPESKQRESTFSEFGAIVALIMGREFPEGNKRISVEEIASYFDHSIPYRGTALGKYNKFNNDKAVIDLVKLIRIWRKYYPNFQLENIDGYLLCKIDTRIKKEFDKVRGRIPVDKEVKKAIEEASAY